MPHRSLHHLESTSLETDYPQRLLKLYLLVSIASLVVVLILMSWGIHAIFKEYNVREAERDGITFGYTLFQLERDALLSDDAGKLRLEISEQEYAGFDQRMRQFLAPMDIIKIKIFTPDERIIYSTDRHIVGEYDRNNPALQQALRGEVRSKLENKDVVADLGDESLFDVDVVEAYLPLLDPQHRILGAFEVYLDVTKYREQIQQAMTTALLVIGSLLGASFFVLYLLMSRGTRQLSEVQRDLGRMASVDALTGLYNRRHLETRLLEEFARLHRADTDSTEYQVGLVMVDLDRFKQINDEHGHLTGDGVLIALAERLKGSVRGQDIIGRYGGEEFLVILPDTDIERCTMGAERIWEAIRDAPLEAEGKLHRATASLGVTCMTVFDQNVWDAINRADEALYQAKEDGRDRIVVIDPPAEAPPRPPKNGA